MKGYQQNGKIEIPNSHFATETTIWHLSTDNSAIVGALESRRDVVKPLWSLRYRRTSLRKQAHVPVAGLPIVGSRL